MNSHQRRKEYRKLRDMIIYIGDTGLVVRMGVPASKKELRKFMHGFLPVKNSTVKNRRM